MLKDLWESIWEVRKMKKIIGIFVCTLLILTVLPVSGNVIVDNTTSSNISGNTLYVGGSGDGNYTKIQDAIDDASEGDTVFVYDDSSPYYENLIINTSIELIGENKQTTIIDGFENEVDEADVITIYADGVTVQGFTIQNSFQPEHFWGDNYSFCGIEIWSDYNTIKNNIILDNFYGIHVGSVRLYDTSNDYPDNNIIEENIISENGRGISILLGSNNLISENYISSNRWGIDVLFYGNNNLITLNNITLNEVGIRLNGVKNITINQNTIIDNQLVGVLIEYSARIKVLENNIYNNNKDTSFYVFSFFFIREWLTNRFDGNYWGEEKKLPVLIPGLMHMMLLFIIGDISFLDDLLINLPIFRLDLHPAQEPYDIEV